MECERVIKTVSKKKRERERRKTVWGVEYQMRIVIIWSEDRAAKGQTILRSCAEEKTEEDN